MAEAITVLRRDAVAFALADQPGAQLRTLGLLTEAYRAAHRTADAERVCRDAVALAKQQQDPEQLMHGYNNLGNVYACMGKIPQAIASYARSLDLCLRVGDVSRAMSCTINLGVLHRTRNDFSRAVHFLHSTIAFAETHKIIAGLDEQYWCQAHIELGNLYAQHHAFARAHQHIEQARRLAETRASCRKLWFWAVATAVEICRDDHRAPAAAALVPEMRRLATTAETRKTAEQIVASLGLPS